MRHSSPAALAALLALGLVPWTLLASPGDVTFVMSWGLVNTNPWHLLWFSSYLGATQGFETLPWSLQVWPLGLVFYLGAVVSATSGVVFAREDIRVTVGLLVLSAISSVFVWWGLLARGATGAVPIGVVAVGVVLWWFYFPLGRSDTDR